jgi:hypothetical protein
VNDPWGTEKRSFFFMFQNFEAGGELDDFFVCSLTQTKERQVELILHKGLYYDWISLDVNQAGVRVRCINKKVHFVIEDWEDIPVIEALLLRYNFNINFIQRHAVWFLNILFSF